ncbi:type IX secretion system ring protein PorN/GldN [Aureibacter tunicatorum]|uniref:Gliding motility associated protein GldN n=1 Tax=Aureibacter tunicatorum TaxID=866807 RepID=A0AAE4BNU2_9BACT|nr:gliding motility protein GldN [Aureibacter tunicatorum]MDR6237204.1 gliding motility associated protein GldN [Aureibacter tunicatorum]BDD06196.1 hypothetical protein AUTU_36790 [Aureibacter tunicatorum]
MSLIKYAFTFVMSLMVLAPAMAQEETDTYNQNSVLPISKHDQLYRKRVWRRMDLKEKQNKPFFSKNNEITQFIIDAVLEGALPVYTSDSLNKRMPKEQFIKNISLPVFEDEDDEWASEGDDWGDSSEEEVTSNPYYFANSFSVLEIMEDVIFDRKRSRLYFDIQSVCMWLPARDKDPDDTPLDEPVGFFKYKDLESLFRSNPDDAIWYNRKNENYHLNLADAFLLRQFHARIIKVSNPDDLSLEEIYPTTKRALFASQEEEFKMMEMEHNLWEF